MKSISEETEDFIDNELYILMAMIYHEKQNNISSIEKATNTFFQKHFNIDEQKEAWFTLQIDSFCSQAKLIIFASINNL